MMQPCERCDILKDIGPRNRSGVIQYVTEIQDEFGQPIETWVDLRGWRFARRDLRGWERVRAGQELAERISSFKGLWFAPADAKMRVLHDDLVWDITAVAELGRRVGLELSVTAISGLMAAGPSAEAALVAILTQGSPNPVAAIVGPRVYALQMPQNPVYPAITYQRILHPKGPIPNPGRARQLRQPTFSTRLLVARFRDGRGTKAGCVWGA